MTRMQGKVLRQVLWIGLSSLVCLSAADARAQRIVIGGRELARPQGMGIQLGALPQAGAPQSGVVAAKEELPPVDPSGYEVRLNDDSRMKLALADEIIEVKGRYGTLRIPANEILRIEFAARVNAETREQIEKTLAELGSPDEEVRDAAALQLTRLRHAAYPLLAQAARDAQSPVGQQAAALIGKLQPAVSETDFAPREADMIYTVDDTIAGMIVAPALKVRTAQFGELTLKLADARSLRLQSLPAEGSDSDDDQQILTDPGTLASFYATVGTVLRFRLVGNPHGSVWGTDVYTADSALAAAAIHAGVLQPGVTGVVKVKLVQPPTHFNGSDRNGVDSNAYGAYPKAYQFVK